MPANGPRARNPMSTLSVLTRNISWNYVQASVNLVVHFVLTPIVVARLGAVGYGIWVLLNAILFYLKFLDLGFYNSLVKYVAEFAERKEWSTVNGLTATTIAALAVAGIVAFAGSCVVAWWFVPHMINAPSANIEELQTATLLIGANLVVAFPGSALSAVLEGRQRFDILSTVAIPITIASAIATVVVLSFGYGVIALVLVTIGSTVFSAAGNWAFLRRLYPEIRLDFAAVASGMRFSHIHQIRGYSTWTSLNEILAEGGAELEKLLIPVLLTVSLLTPYTLIVTVAAAIFLVIEPITDALFPLTSAVDAIADRVRLRKVLVRGTKLVVGVSLPLAIAIFFFGRDFILIWIGADNVDVPAGVLPLVVLSFSITAFILPGTTILLAMSRVKEVFWMGVAELVLATSLVILTVPSMGLKGLAGSLLASNVAITFGWIVPYLCRSLEQSIRGFLGATILRPALAAVPMGLLMLYLDRFHLGESLWRMALGCALAGTVYALAFYVMSLTAQERASLSGMLRAVLLRRAG